MGATTFLETENLTLSFGGVTAVDHLTIQIPPKQITGVIGPNGAGKTSFFNCLTGVYRPNEGSIRFCGQEICGLSPDAIARLGMIRTFQNLRLFPRLSVWENLLSGFTRRYLSSPGQELLGLGKGKSGQKAMAEQASMLLASTGLSGREEVLAGDLPYGDRKRLEWARALAAQPKLLLLDEPAAGLNHGEKEELLALLNHCQKERDMAILLIEHDMELITAATEHLIVLDQGRLLAQGNPTEVLRLPEVARAYLGKGEEREKWENPCCGSMGSPSVTIRWKS